ncbi:glycosyltransferase family 4 protein [Aureimonas altamirensis]|uniref:glycosyltransferase family 4 protein n=1 Tax=Aureimonas altamirensis TaxID=370622 RepID=UPI001E5CC09C|nr:glycosyltransferase family 4 protein [Aureimonas altamirensis]UHD46147.1 glycosyltransferase family 4 protein [Aureimonas altamirensis]
MNGGRKLAFIVTEDWFFASHFLPMIAAASAAGFEPVVITRVRDHARVIEAAGAHVIAFEADRRSLNPIAVARSVKRLADILRRERIGRVHLIALRSILIGGAAASLTGIRKRVFAVTGGGVLTARKDRLGRFSARSIVCLIRKALETSETQYLFENPDDPVSFGLAPGDARVTIVGGAGIDPDHFRPMPMPEIPPLKVAIVARMVWSKGIDLAVEAVTRARARGAAIELSLFGAPDAQNPKSIPESTLKSWSAREGIGWHGVVTDVRAVWNVHHVACLPSRGGEGLPRTLLEAAACGRALLTTDVPGCRSFVRDRIDGLVVAPDDAKALEDALVSLWLDPDRVRSYGVSARDRVERGFTEKDVAAATTALYRRWGP